MAELDKTTDKFSVKPSSTRDKKFPKSFLFNILKPIQYLLKNKNINDEFNDNKSIPTNTQSSSIKSIQINSDDQYDEYDEYDDENSDDQYDEYDDDEELDDKLKKQTISKPDMLCKFHTAIEEKNKTQAKDILNWIFLTNPEWYVTLFPKLIDKDKLETIINCLQLDEQAYPNLGKIQLTIYQKLINIFLSARGITPQRDDAAINPKIQPSETLEEIIQISKQITTFVKLHEEINALQPQINDIPFAYVYPRTKAYQEQCLETLFSSKFSLKLTPEIKLNRKIRSSILNEITGHHLETHRLNQQQIAEALPKFSEQSILTNKTFLISCELNNNANPLLCYIADGEFLCHPQDKKTFANFFKHNKIGIPIAGLLERLTEEERNTFNSELTKNHNSKLTKTLKNSFHLNKIKLINKQKHFLASLITHNYLENTFFGRNDFFIVPIKSNKQTEFLLVRVRPHEIICYHTLNEKTLGYIKNQCNNGIHQSISLRFEELPESFENMQPETALEKHIKNIFNFSTAAFDEEIKNNQNVKNLLAAYTNTYARIHVQFANTYNPNKPFPWNKNNQSPYQIAIIPNKTPPGYLVLEKTDNKDLAYIMTEEVQDPAKKSPNTIYIPFKKSMKNDDPKIIAGLDLQDMPRNFDIQPIITFLKHMQKYPRTREQRDTNMAKEQAATITNYLEQEHSAKRLMKKINEDLNKLLGLPENDKNTKTKPIITRKDSLQNNQQSNRDLLTSKNTTFIPSHNLNDPPRSNFYKQSNFYKKTPISAYKSNINPYLSDTSTHLPIH